MQKKSKSAADYALSTQLIHGGNKLIEGAIIPPIFQSANFVQGKVEHYTDIKYSRLSNTPQHLQLHEKLALLDRAEAALTFASGMAAVATTFLGLLSAGDHVLIQNPCYGGTTALVSDLERLGIETTFIDAGDATSYAKSAKANTKMIYVESISNPLLMVADLKGALKFAKTHGLISVIDNTFLSPAGFLPIPMGFDVVVHSATKFMNGHSDITVGVVACSEALLKPIHVLASHLGGSLDPHAAFLLDRGLKTLSLRYKAQCENAQGLAEFLNAHPKVERVLFPGLPHHPGHAAAKELFNGFGAVLSFESSVKDLLKRLKLPKNAASLGSVESLIVKPSESTHIAIDKNLRRASGISDNLTRVAVGIEDLEDLIADFKQALN